MHGCELLDHLRHSYLSSSSSLVIVRYFNLFRAFRGPHETNPELIVDPDRVLTCAVTFQSLKTVARRGFQSVPRRR
jgi:hypothetical protein